MSIGATAVLAPAIIAGLLAVACSADRPSAEPPSDETGTAPPSGPEGPSSVRPRRPAPPRPGATWQYQLSGELDLTVDAEVFDIDGDLTTADQLEALHRQGAYVICYVSAGSWEGWRQDASSFPEDILGRPLEGWPDERWIDIRRLDVVLPVIESRVERCAAEGFDAVELDNVDGWSNETGFEITAADQLVFNRALAAAAHRHGLAVGLKNDAEQAAELVDDFDFAVVEECVAHGECHQFEPFVEAAKAVFVVEYEGDIGEICATAAQLGAHAILKDLDLGPARRSC